MVVDKLKSWAMKMSDKDKELRRWSQGRERFTSAGGTLEEVEPGEKRACKLKMTLLVKVKQLACCRSVRGKKDPVRFQQRPQ